MNDRRHSPWRDRDFALRTASPQMVRRFMLPQSPRLMPSVGGGGGGGMSPTFDNIKTGMTVVADEPWDVSPSYPNVGPPSAGNVKRGSPVRNASGFIPDTPDSGNLWVDVFSPAGPRSSTHAAIGNEPAGAGMGGATFSLRNWYGRDGSTYYREMRVGAWLYWSSPYDNTNGNAGSKIFWLDTTNDHDGGMYMTLDGPTMKVGFVSQYSGNSTELYSNVGTFSDSQMANFLGQWVKWEMRWRCSSADLTADGSFEMWINEKKSHNYINNVAMRGGTGGIGRTFQGFDWENTYGGGLNPIPYQMYENCDHITIYGTNT